MKKIALAAFLLTSCSQPNSKPATFEGYGPFKFGMSLTEALSASGPSQFAALSVKDCLTNIAIKGCILMPDSNLANAETHDGIGYGYELFFNKHDKLTDIDLLFMRRSGVDEQTVTRDQCADIAERTVDWVTKQYGKLGYKLKKDPTLTTKGNPYWVTEFKETKSYVAEGSTPIAQGREVSLLATYIQISPELASCAIDVSFREPNAVERMKFD